MARIRGHERLREDKPLYVLRTPITSNGVTYEKGHPFPWQEIPGMTPRLLRLLHDQRRIGHERPEDPPQGAEEPDRSPQEQARADARDAGRTKPRAKPAGSSSGGRMRGLG